MLTPKRFIAGAALTDTYTALYTVPSTVTSATTKQIVVCNTDTNVQSFSLQVRAAAGSDTVACTMFKDVSLQPKETKIFGLTDVLPGGYSIYAKAATTSVISITASGMEYA